MSRILITSDLHFDSYPTRTPSKDYRLNQSFQVVENLLKIASREGADYLFMLGDLLEKQNRDSPVHSTVKKCLEKLMTGFKVGYYILGNHDMTAKSVGAESTENDMLNSYIHLYCPGNLVYADKKVVDIDGMTFGFRNYSSAPELDLSFIEDSGRSQVDVLLGHSSQSYGEGEPPYPVQAYDEGKVGLYAFFGHIHQSVWKGNKISIGVPQRCKISDDSPKVVILDTIDKTWRYVDADPDHKLMDFKETTAGDADYFDQAQNIYYIVKKKPSENKELLKSINETNYDKIFEAEIKARGLSDIFAQVKDQTPVDALERLDLDFMITEARIKNWRTIKDFKINFKKGDQYLVSGHNGSGKSSLYGAIMFCLTGDCIGNLNDNIRFGEKDTRIEVDLEYQGDKYTIKRGNSFVEFWKNGALQELGNKIQTREKIREALPFLEAADLMFYNRGNQRILGGSSASDTGKLQILYKILGLSEIDAYNGVAKKLQEGYQKDYAKLRDLYISQEAILGEKKKYLEALEFKYGRPEEGKIQKLQETLQGYQDLYRQKQEYDKVVQENQRAVSEMEGTKLMITELQTSLLALGDQEKIQKTYQDLQVSLGVSQGHLQELLGYQTEYTKLSGQREFILQEGQRLRKSLEDLEEEIKRPVMCSTYGIQCSLITEEMKRQKLADRKTDLENQRTQKLQEYYAIEKALQEVTYSPEAIQESSKEVSRIQGELTEAAGKIREYTRIQGQLSEKTRYLDSLTSRTLKGLPKPIELPGDILTRISDLTAEISVLSGFQGLKDELKGYQEDFDRETTKMKNLEDTLTRYTDFISLTNPSGIIYTKIFQIIMESFSDTKVRYEVNVKVRNAKRYINISAYLKKKDGEAQYDNASDGERCMMDIHFLSNLKVKFGILILDEFLGNLDEDNHDDGLLKLQSLQTNLLFVTSHKDNLLPFPNRIEATMVNGNETKYTIG